MLHGAGMWSCCAAGDDGFIYCLPSNARQILRLGSSGTTEAEPELWGPDFGEETWKWTVAVIGPEGAIWGIPGNAPRILCIANGRVEFVGPPMEGTHKWHAAVLAPDGCIYAPPCDGGQVLRIDCGRRYVSLLGPIMGGAGKYCACAVAANGYVYCPPNHAAGVLRISPPTKQVELIGPDLRFGGGGGYVAAVTGADGNVYCPPFSATRVLRISDPEVDLVGPEMDWMAHQWRSAMLASDGCIYAVPCNASRVLKINIMGEVSLVGPEFPCSPAPEGIEKWRSCCEVDGCVYAIPSHAKQLLRIKTGAAALESLTFADVEAQKLADSVEEEMRLRAEAAAKPQDAGSSQEEEDDDDEENSDIEDVEDWPEEECDGVSLCGPFLGQRWTRKNKFRAALAGPSSGMLVAPPYHCGQLLMVQCGSQEELEVQLMGDAPPKPPKKVFIPLPDEDE